MSSKQIPITFLRVLSRLSQGEELRASDISSKVLLKKFVADGMIRERAVSKHRCVYVCPNSESLDHYLNAQYDILSLENYIQQIDEIASDGEASLEATKSTKTFRQGSLKGFFVKAFGASLFVNKELVKSMPDGIELFVHQPEKLRIPSDVLIVGVENPECFVKFEQVRSSFPEQDLLLVMRYMSLSPNEWLETLPNSYLHFGDFDPAGISIYINEYRNRLGAERCQFYIPSNIEYLLQKYGSTALYDKQQHQIKNIKSDQYPEIAPLIDVLNKYKKGLEQERLLMI